MQSALTSQKIFTGIKTELRPKKQPVNSGLGRRQRNLKFDYRNQSSSGCSEIRFWRSCSTALVMSSIANGLAMVNTLSR